MQKLLKYIKNWIIFIEIVKILDNVSDGEIDYRDWKELPSRKNIAMGIDYIKNNQ